jgi:undecaprenyl diphosphate synthase
MSQSEQLPDILPRHVAIIMDGNGRWAQRRGLPRIEGHRRGVKSVREMVEAGADLGLEQLTLFCLSSENWKRPESELRRLMNLLEQFLVEERSTIMREGLRFATIGRREGLSDGVLREIDKTVKISSENTGMRLCLALNYGARTEIADAATAIARQVVAGELSIDDIDECTVENNLYTAGMPDPDLLIRTAGELRISNYLLWQISYAELWVTEKFWPEFRRPDLIEACHAFASRDRRYGGLKG